jgi:hypothetical protein
MSIKIMDRVWDHSQATGTPLLVLLCLADWANDDGECWPSVSKIGKKCRLQDDRHVKRVIRGLQELGEVIVVIGGGKSSRKGGVRSNLYTITVHMPAEQTVADRPPSETADRGSQTPHDGGLSTTHDRGSQTPQTVVEGPPEPSVNHQADPSGRPVDLSRRRRPRTRGAARTVVFGEEEVISLAGSLKELEYLP